MPVKHCCYGVCKSDSRNSETTDMEGVFFIPFPKPKTQPEKCQRWISCCGRPHNSLNVGKVNTHTFICSKHFIGGKGPTDEYPDPVPAIQLGSTTYVKKARRPPRVRSSTPTKVHSDHDYACSYDPPLCTGGAEICTSTEIDMDISIYGIPAHPPCLLIAASR